MALTRQERIALALTSAGSQRSLARSMGVSARTLGRWLREGEPEGVKAIPDYADDAINAVFAIHRDIVIDQAQADKIPYNYYRPIFLERKTLRTGKPGDRVVGDNTEFIRSDLRQQVMQDQQRSERYISASVRSIIDLKRYFRLDADGNVKQRYLKKSTPALTAASNLNQFVARERREKGRIIDKHEPFPLYTRYEDISPLRAKTDLRGVVGIEEQLRQKHEPATGAPGTLTADQYLFQLLPAQYVEKLRLQKQSKKQQARNKRSAKKAPRK